MKFRQLTNNVISDLNNDKLLKSNGRPYAKSSKDFYTRALKIVVQESEDFDLDSNLDIWVRNLRSNLRLRGVENSTENSYISAVQWVFSRFNDYGYEISAKGREWSKISDIDQMIVPENQRVVDMIKGYRANGITDDAFKYVVAGVFTGARYGDMAQWTKENLIYKDGLHLEYVPKKTKNKSITVPIHPFLEKQFDKKGKLLPEIPYTTLLDHVKKIFKNAGFTEIVKRRRRVGNEEKVEEYEMWELMGLHRLRASTISGMLESGMSETDVKSFSGHSINSDSFKRYVKLSQKHLDKSYNQYQSRF